MLRVSDRSITSLQNFTDGGKLVNHNYLIFNESCLEKVLEATGHKGAFRQNNGVCPICGVSINKKNLRAIVPNGSNNDFLCFKSSCIDAYFYSRSKR